MTTAYTSLLGLAQPVNGELNGTWGTIANEYITAYLDAAIAGAQVISGSQTAVTLSKTTGSSLSQAGTGTTGSSQYQIIRCTGNPASLLTITAPAADKTYIIINATSTSQSVKIVGAGPTTGVTITSGTTNIVAWDGSDFTSLSSGYTPGGALGTPSSGNLTNCTADGTNGVGYKNIPQSGSDKTTAYTLATTDVGKYIGVGTSGSIVVPTSTFANGDAISIFNNTSGNVTLTTSAPTAYIGGVNTVKTSITLATRGIATIIFVSSTVCVVTGNVS